MLKIDKKFAVTVAISILVTILVYIGIVTSLERPTLSRIPLTEENAVSIVIDKKNLNSSDRQDFVTEFVHIKGNGSFYESNLNSNYVGKHLGDSHPTINNANYFAWKVTDRVNNFTYLIDPLNGEIVSEINQ
ncbi:MAG: hypothetical protein ACRD47_08115 [Nitrososphaeraceae archaeon]